MLSSSLSYLDWYTYEDLDGDTAVITIGADVAASRGIVVCNSAGNQGNQDWYYITAPSDGDSIISVGALDWDGVLAGFSSHGPTFDGRTKPEVCARGVDTYCAIPPDQCQKLVRYNTAFNPRSPIAFNRKSSPSRTWKLYTPGSVCREGTMRHGCVSGPSLTDAGGSPSEQLNSRVRMIAPGMPQRYILVMKLRDVTSVIPNTGHRMKSISYEFIIIGF